MDPEYKLWKKVTTVFMNKYHFLSFTFAVVVFVFVVAGVVAGQSRHLTKRKQHSQSENLP